MRKTCCLCDVELNEKKDSEEHIIIAAIGGRQTVRGVLCRSCNERTGTTWDAELARQLNPLSLFLRISRQRRDTPRQIFKTSDNGLIAVTSSGLELAKPEVRVTEVDGRLDIRIFARNEAQAREMMIGLKKKYPNIDVEASINQGLVEDRAEYLDSFVQMEVTIGGPLAGRSIVKSALVLAVSVGADSKNLEESRRYLLENGPPNFGYISDGPDIILNRPDGAPLHCVAVQTVNGMLLGYYEAFSIYKMVVCLARPYIGPDIKAFVGVDPTTGYPLQLDFDLGSAGNDVDGIYDYKRMDVGLLERDFRRVIQFGMRRQLMLEQPKALERSYHQAMRALGKAENDLLLPEEQHRFVQLVSQGMMPFFMQASKMGFTFFPTLERPSDLPEEPALPKLG